MRIKPVFHRDGMRLSVDMTKTQALVLFIGTLLIGGILICLGSMVNAGMAGSALIIAGILTIIGLSLGVFRGSAEMEVLRQGPCTMLKALFSLKGLKWVLFIGLSAVAIGGIVTLMLGSIQEGIFWTVVVLILTLLTGIFQAITMHDMKDKPAFNLAGSSAVAIGLGSLTAIILLFGDRTDLSTFDLVMVMGMNIVLLLLTGFILVGGLVWVLTFFFKEGSCLGITLSVPVMIAAMPIINPTPIINVMPIITRGDTILHLLVWAGCVLTAVALTCMGVAARHHAKALAARHMPDRNTN